MNGAEIIAELVRKLEDKNIRCNDGAIISELRKMSRSEVKIMINKSK